MESSAALIVNMKCLPMSRPALAVTYAFARQAALCPGAMAQACQNARILIPPCLLIAGTRASAAKYHDGRSNGPGAQSLLRLSVFELQADTPHGVGQQ